MGGLLLLPANGPTNGLDCSQPPEIRNTHREDIQVCAEMESCTLYERLSARATVNEYRGIIFPNALGMRVRYLALSPLLLVIND